MEEALKARTAALEHHSLLPFTSFGFSWPSASLPQPWEWLLGLLLQWNKHRPREVQGLAQGPWQGQVKARPRLKSQQESSGL